MNKYFFRKHWLLTILFLLCGLIIVLTFFRQRINSNSTQKSKSEIVDDFDAKIIEKRENSILVEAFDYRKEILVSTKLLEERLLCPGKESARKCGVMKRDWNFP